MTMTGKNESARPTRTLFRNLRPHRDATCCVLRWRSPRSGRLAERTLPACARWVAPGLYVPFEVLAPHLDAAPEVHARQLPALYLLVDPAPAHPQQPAHLRHREQLQAALVHRLGDPLVEDPLDGVVHFQGYAAQLLLAGDARGEVLLDPLGGHPVVRAHPFLVLADAYRGDDPVARVDDVVGGDRLGDEGHEPLQDVAHQLGRRLRLPVRPVAPYRRVHRTPLFLTAASGVGLVILHVTSPCQRGFAQPPALPRPARGRRGGTPRPRGSP